MCRELLEIDQLWLLILDTLAQKMSSGVLLSRILQLARDHLDAAKIGFRFKCFIHSHCQS
jgi:hypothetical protein